VQLAFAVEEPYNCRLKLFLFDKQTEELDDDH